MLALETKDTARPLLVVDDDTALCAMIAEFLSPHGFSVEAVHNGPKGLAAAIRGAHDLILLDIMLPVLDGLSVLHQLRQRTDVPVILLTARTAEQDRIHGLDAGADDYVTKPLSPPELLARIRAVLRRSAPFPATQAPLEAGGIELHPRSRRVRYHGAAMELTPFEFDILEMLMHAAGRVVSRDELAAVLYHREATPFERSIDVHISHLRKKLESNGQPLIRTIHGVGYLLAEAGTGDTQ
jgi:two-component system, OmpR family, response regulator CpxR